MTLRQHLVLTSRTNNNTLAIGLPSLCNDGVDRAQIWYVSTWRSTSQESYMSQTWYMNSLVPRIVTQHHSLVAYRQGCRFVKMVGGAQS